MVDFLGTVQVGPACCGCVRVCGCVPGVRRRRRVRCGASPELGRLQPAAQQPGGRHLSAPPRTRPPPAHARLQASGRAENLVGWYHSHPGYGCWLSGIDVGTQTTNQKYQEPFLAVRRVLGRHAAAARRWRCRARRRHAALAPCIPPSPRPHACLSTHACPRMQVVVDPHRTVAAGKVEIGAFRTYPEVRATAAGVVCLWGVRGLASQLASGRRRGAATSAGTARQRPVPPLPASAARLPASPPPCRGTSRRRRGPPSTRPSHWTRLRTLGCTASRWAGGLARGRQSARAWLACAGTAVRRRWAVSTAVRRAAARPATPRSALPPPPPPPTQPPPPHTHVAAVLPTGGVVLQVIAGRAPAGPAVGQVLGGRPVLQPTHQHPHPGGRTAGRHRCGAGAGRRAAASASASRVLAAAAAAQGRWSARRERCCCCILISHWPARPPAAAGKKLEAVEGQVSSSGRMGRFVGAAAAAKKGDEGKLEQVVRDTARVAAEQVKGLSTQVRGVIPAGGWMLSRLQPGAPGCSRERPSRFRTRPRRNSAFPPATPRSSRSSCSTAAAGAAAAAAVVTARQKRRPWRQAAARR